LTSYLLGELSTEDESTLELEYLRDDDAFDRLVVVEDELAYDYVEGRLNGARRERFERTIGATERGRSNVEFARALLGALRASQVAERRMIPRFWAAAIAAAILLAAPFTWLSLEVRRLRGELATVKATPTAPAATPAPAPLEVAMLLTPGRTRSNGATPRLEIASGVDRVRLELVAPSGAAAGDAAIAIRGESGADLFSRSVSRTGPAWVAEVPAAIFVPGDYQVSVSTLTGSEMASYFFRVVRR
jgi:hypothetical protein